MNVNKIGYILTILYLMPQLVAAQWFGAGAPPLTPAQEEVTQIGSETLPPSSPGGPSPKITVSGEGWGTPPVYELKAEYIEALKMNPAQEKALKEFMPEFKPWTIADYRGYIKYYPFSKRQLPNAVSWDYNGKKSPILIIAGHVGQDSCLVAFEPRKDGSYQPRRVGLWVGNLSSDSIPALRLVREGSVAILHDYENESERLRHMGFAEMTAYPDSPRPDRFNIDITQGVDYYHEGLLPIKTEGIIGLKTNKPSAFKEKYLKRISITTEMAEAVKSYNKDFTIWTDADYPKDIVSSYHYSENSLPYAVRHDFNNDGVDDMVVVGHDHDSNMVLELLSDGTGYYVHTLGTHEPCYSAARERKEYFEFKPSHIIDLYEKDRTFTSISTAVTGSFWHYKEDALVAMRPLNMCKEPDKSRNLDEMLPPPQYGKWRPLFEYERKESILIYGEKISGIGGCLGADNCGLELLPPGSPLKKADNPEQEIIQDAASGGVYGQDIFR